MPRPSFEAKSTLTAQQSGAQDLILRLCALAFTAVWLGAAGLYAFAGSPAEVPFFWAFLELLAGLPVILAWVLTGTIISLRRLNAQAATLQKTIDGLRAAQTRVTPSRQNSDMPAQARIALALTPAPLGPETDAQPALALGPEIDDLTAPLAVADWLRALHFPNSPDDAEGLRALRLALADHDMGKLIRSAQDVLTLLAEDGIFMDNLSPDRPRPELWRKFAAGERGGIISGLGGVRDRSCLALTAARMRGDVVFRDAAHHFLRSFDKAIATLEPQASDIDLSALSDTRTARAFMLFGRVTGTFDERRPS